jgi:calcineurin-like phosphoesterase family protein
MKPSTTAERYFTHLGTQFVRDDGKTKQPASGKFIDVLREVHQAYRPRFNLAACIAGTQPGFKGRVWFWSDLHFFHEKVIQYCNRPFADMPAMNEGLLRNCLERVTAADIVVFGGDITMRNVPETNAMLRAIPAYKINILGNHDVEHRTLLKLAVDEIAPCLELEAFGKSLFFCHYPMPERLLAPEQLNVHGHLHTTALHPSLGDGSRHINMSVEHTGYAPVTLDWLLTRPR